MHLKVDKNRSNTVQRKPSKYTTKSLWATLWVLISEFCRNFGLLPQFFDGIRLKRI